MYVILGIQFWLIPFTMLLVPIINYAGLSRETALLAYKRVSNRPMSHAKGTEMETDARPFFPTFRTLAP